MTNVGKANAAPGQRHTVCRVCQVACDLVVTVEDGEINAIHGNKHNPVYYGYSCIKGRAQGELMKSSSRLLHSLERQADGSQQPTEARQAINNAAARLRQIVDEHGPRSVALFTGTYCTINLLFDAFAKSFMHAIGSPMLFDNITIDQPGKVTASGLHGTWLAGTPPMEEWDALLLVGTNPIISMNGGLGVNPARQLKQLQERGMKLVVIDPRRSECAAKADIHLQARPGEDAAIMAGLIRQLINDNQLDDDFIAAETQGFAELKAAVEPFTPELVAERAGIDAGQLVAAARILGGAGKGAASFGTGANMSGKPSTVEYLGRVLTSLRGWWRRAGDELKNPGIFFEPMPPIAATIGPLPVAGLGEKMRVRGMAASLAGNPLAALADEILTPGEGQVRALIVAGANPVLAWPDQARTVAALEKLDLLVCIDPFMSETARMADYVFATKLGLECETNSAANEKWALGGPGWGYEQPYAQVAPPVMVPPAGSDLREDWEVFFDLAQAMGLQLKLQALHTVDPMQADALGTELDMSQKPTTTEAWATAFKGAPVPYAQLYAQLSESAEPRLLDRPALAVQEKPEGWVGSLELAAALVMEELAGIAQQAPAQDDNFPFRLISRRLNDIINSFGRENPVQLRKWHYNPAFMHGDDLAKLGVSAGDLVEIRSASGRIIGVTEEDNSVRPGCVSMPGSWGRHPQQEQRPRIDGANPGCLIAVDRDLEALTGQPLMSAIPIAVTPVADNA